MFAVFKIFALLAVFSAVNGIDAQKKWWETATFYQIYPRSFKDSDGNGIGDLKGITEQLPYLKELGVTATWLSPIFKSPMADYGYDIADFYDIDPLFGTMADFDALVAKARELDLKIILDFVPNHSSDESEWFVKSAARDPEYKDYYVWHPGKIVNGTRQPPNNWISVFRGSAWSWHPKRQEYYLHQFHAKQPDFNYRNPKVRNMMNDVLRFWLRRGAHGFRIDAVAHCFEVPADANGNYPDEPRNVWNNNPEDYEYLSHVYTKDLQETVELVYEFRATIDQVRDELKSEDFILMTEVYSSIENVMKYYGNGTVDGAQMPFNFQLFNLNINSNAYQYVQIIESWLHNMPTNKTANWVIGNHDNTRIGTRLGADRMDMMNVLLAGLPGCSVTYQGEEIGMTDVWLSWEETVDPAGCQSNPQEYENISRDPCRTPFQWSDDENAGFSQNSSTWLPVGKDYKLVNVKRERGIAMSHLNIYKQLRSLRHTEVFQYGETEVKALSDNVLAVKRYLRDGTAFVVVLNVMDNVETINLHAAFSGLSTQMEYVLVTEKSYRRQGDRVYTDSILLMPKESIILSNIF